MFDKCGFWVLSSHRHFLRITSCQASPGCAAPIAAPNTGKNGESIIELTQSLQIFQPLPNLSRIPLKE